MDDYILDAIEQMGYPREYHRKYCPSCGEELSFLEDIYEVDYGKWMCNDCFEDWIGSMSNGEIARRMDLNTKKAAGL